jgi:hypothetical protein
MLVLIVATVCAGLFAGAAIYITAVEHPARLASGTEVARTLAAVLSRRDTSPFSRRSSAKSAPLLVTHDRIGVWTVMRLVA